MDDLEKVTIIGYHIVQCEDEHWHVVISALRDGEPVEFSREVASPEEGFSHLHEINYIEEHL